MYIYIRIYMSSVGMLQKLPRWTSSSERKKHKFYPLRREETNTGNPYDNAQHVDLHATSCKFKK